MSSWDPLVPYEAKKLQKRDRSMNLFILSTKTVCKTTSFVILKKKK